MPEYRLSKLAQEDLIRIFGYGVHQFGERQAEIYFDKIFASFEQIAERPYSYEAVNDIKEGYRRYVLGPDTIYYRIVNSVVEIMAIVGRQDLENLI